MYYKKNSYYINNDNEVHHECQSFLFIYHHFQMVYSKDDNVLEKSSRKIHSKGKNLN